MRGDGEGWRKREFQIFRMAPEVPPPQRSLIGIMSGWAAAARAQWKGGAKKVLVLANKRHITLSLRHFYEYKNVM